ncbi:MAG: ABC transporter ATP-binding protein [Clostridia bacterium]|nr:ABC transporter ATP-binding protein [Clostridia bacterium]MBQ8447216.1 ABC transporter ATP-binding protein [Clostridia bacterium]
MKEVLRFDDVSMHYHNKQGETVALQDVNFSVSEGEFVAIIGPSGCGKTTLLSLAAGLLKPTKGKIHNAGGSFGYMLQKDELFSWRTIEKNIFLPLEIKRKDTLENRARAVALAEKYGLKQFLKNYPSSLSGGMRQRAALIRTLAVDPDVLLLDEPFSALDYQTRLSVCDDVYKIIRSEEKTALLITHDISEAISVADTIFVLSRRPAKVVAEHHLNFPETEPLKRRENKEFSRWFEILWKELNT